MKRGLNKQADFLANYAVDNQKTTVEQYIDCEQFDKNFIAIRGFSDGGARNQSDWETDGVASCGWLVEAALSFSAGAGLCWLPVLRGCIWLGVGYNSFAAELAGAEALVYSLLWIFGIADPNCWVASIFDNHLTNSLHLSERTL